MEEKQRFKHFLCAQETFWCVRWHWLLHVSKNKNLNVSCAFINHKIHIHRWWRWSRWADWRRQSVCAETELSPVLGVRLTAQSCPLQSTEHQSTSHFLFLGFWFWNKIWEISRFPKMWWMLLLRWFQQHVDRGFEPEDLRGLDGSWRGCRSEMYFGLKPFSAL